MNLPNNTELQTCITMSFHTFKELVEKAEESDEYDNRNITDILSDCFEIPIAEIIYNQHPNKEDKICLLCNTTPTGILPKNDMLRMMKQNNCIQGIVRVDINELTTYDFEMFLDILSIRLTGTDLLSDISYQVIGCEINNTLLVHVTGDATNILHMDEEEAEYNEELLTNK